MQHQLRLHQVNGRGIVCQHSDMYTARAHFERRASGQQRCAYHAIGSADHRDRAEHPLVAVLGARFEEGSDLLPGDRGGAGVGHAVFPEFVRSAAL